MEMPELVIALVMRSGCQEDVCRLTDTVGLDGLRWILQIARAGMFDVASWRYWHYRLELAQFHNMPPLPGTHGEQAVSPLLKPHA
jgi:hypothetical protein